jgi:hypothetical protein
MPLTCWQPSLQQACSEVAAFASPRPVDRPYRSDCCGPRETRSDVRENMRCTSSSLQRIATRQTETPRALSGIGFDRSEPSLRSGEGAGCRRQVHGDYHDCRIEHSTCTQKWRSGAHKSVGSSRELCLAHLRRRAHVHVRGRVHAITGCARERMEKLRDESQF